MSDYNYHDYNCPDCNEAKLQSDKNARKINEVIDQVNALIQVNNETVDFIEDKANEKVTEIAEREVEKVLENLITRTYINACNPPSSHEPILETDSDISDKVQAMLNEYDIVEIPHGVYNLTNGITIPTGKTLQGKATINILGVKSYITLNNKTEILNLNFIGDKTTGNKAIFSNNSYPINIDSVSFKNFDIAIDGKGVTPSHHDGGAIVNCKFNDCNIGIKASSYFEYVNIIGAKIKNSVTGIKIQGGNILVSSSYICECEVGIEILYGENGGHGVITGNQINHNTKSISLYQVPHGYTITGNNIFYGSLEVKNCSSGGIIISNNTLSCDWNFVDSDIVFNGNYINNNGIDYDKLYISDATSIMARGNMIDPRSDVLKNSKYRTEERVLKINSNTSDELLTLNSNILTNIKHVEYLMQFGKIRRENLESMIQTNGGFISTIRTCCGSVHVQIKIDLLLDTSYSETLNPPTLFFEDASKETHIIPYVERAKFNDGRRHISYCGSVRFINDGLSAFFIKLLDADVTNASKVTVRGGSHIVIYGI